MFQGPHLLTKPICESEIVWYFTSLEAAILRRDLSLLLTHKSDSLGKWNEQRTGYTQKSSYKHMLYMNKNSESSLNKNINI